VADPNVDIQESKALTCDIVAGRHATGARPAAGAPQPSPPSEVPESRRDGPLAGESIHTRGSEKKGQEP
jgi:formate dehydrogenase major subunit